MARGLDLGLGLAAGCGRGVLTGLGGCLAAVLGFGWVVGVGFVGAWALDEDVVVVVDEVVVVVKAVESEAEERAVGDGGGSWASGAGV